MSSDTKAETGAENVRGADLGGGSVAKTREMTTLTLETSTMHDSSPKVDVHAVLGLPRPKRPSEKSIQGEEDEKQKEEAEGEEEEEEREEGSDTDDVMDSDDDTEEWQEGEYLVMDEAEDEEGKQLQTQMLAESANRTRHSLVPMFTALCPAYETWIRENQTKLPDKDMRDRRQQLTLYRKVLELYGSDVEWEGLTHAQRVKRDKMALDTSVEAKMLGLPPTSVTDVWITDHQN